MKDINPQIKEPCPQKKTKQNKINPKENSGFLLIQLLYQRAI